MQSDTVPFKNKGWHLNMFFFIYHVTGGVLCLWKTVHISSISYLILQTNIPLPSLLFLMFSVGLSLWILFHESCLDSVACVILNWNYTTSNLLSEQVTDSCCCLRNVLLLECSNLPETRISLSDEYFFPGIKPEKLSDFAESLRIWINRFESQHCVNPQMNIAPAEKKIPMQCATLESCQLPFSINQDLGDLWLAWCYPPAKWVSSY